MFKKAVCLAVIATALTGITFAQGNWNWPEDKATAEEKNALYSDAITLGQYQNAIEPHQWLLEHAPDLNSSLYINGVKLYKELEKAAKDPVKKKQYQEKVMELYDERIGYFNDEANVLNRKAYDAYKYFKRDKEKYKWLFDLYVKTFELNGSDVSSNNIVAFMDVVQRCKLTGGNISDERILDIYDQLVGIIGQKMKAGGNATRLKRYQEIIDQLLTQVITVDCGFINNKLGQKLEENPEDIKMAKRILALSLDVGCTDSPAFLQAAEIVQGSEPDFTVAKIIASKYLAEEDYDTAEKFYNEALDLAKKNEDRAEIYMVLAKVYEKRGNKSTAREMANNALEQVPSLSEAYKFIGDLYFTSFNQCKQGESKVDDRAVYLVAFDMYQKAGDSKMMNIARQQFPSIENIFNENLEEGSTINVDCWINRSTVLRRRPSTN